MSPAPGSWNLAPGIEVGSATAAAETRDRRSRLSPLAGELAPAALLIDVAKLVTAYYAERPDVMRPEQRVKFGTSGHRGSSLTGQFNERHIQAITQAICGYRRSRGITGPLFLAVDTHALSFPAFVSALEVLAANGIDVLIAEGDDYTPTPALSRAVLTYNRGRSTGLADGIVVTPSHNPPEDGGFKYNPPHGGPAEPDVTRWIEMEANVLLRRDLAGVRRVSFARALRATTTHRHDFRGRYVRDLASVLDLEAIRVAGLRVGADPLGGAGVHYWAAIADLYHLNLTVLDEAVDPTFRFMTVDHDGKIRMDPSSPYAMQRLLGAKDRFDVAVACDTDHDRHGVITRSAGLLPSNRYLAVAIDYLFRHRPRWPAKSAVGKTVVSSQLIDRVTERLSRALYEVPVGFKWFVPGLLDGALGFAGEESAGASFLRRDGTVWTTDKDGIAAALLAAEIMARTDRDPGERYREVARECGDSLYQRVDLPGTAEQKARLEALAPHELGVTALAGEPVLAQLTRAPGNGAPIGGLKVVAESGWFAARPSGTEDILKIYAESFRGDAHLERLVEEARAILRRLLGEAPA